VAELGCDADKIIKGTRITRIYASHGYRVGIQFELEVDGDRLYWFDIEQFHKLLNNNVLLSAGKKRKRYWIEILDKKGYRDIKKEREIRNKRQRKQYEKLLRESSKKPIKLEAI
jgi:spore germination protein YaaH